MQDIPLPAHSVREMYSAGQFRPWKSKVLLGSSGIHNHFKGSHMLWISTSWQWLVLSLPVSIFSSPFYHCSKCIFKKLQQKWWVMCENQGTDTSKLGLPRLRMITVTQTRTENAAECLLTSQTLLPLNPNHVGFRKAPNFVSKSYTTNSSVYLRITSFVLGAERPLREDHSTLS